MSAHSRPMAVAKSVSSGSRAGSSFSNGRAERGATDMAVMIAPMVLPLCRKARYPPFVGAMRWPWTGAQTFYCLSAGRNSVVPPCPRCRLDQITFEMLHISKVSFCRKMRFSAESTPRCGALHSRAAVEHLTFSKLKCSSLRQKPQRPAGYLPPDVPP